MTTKSDFKFNIWINQIEKHINKILNINLDDLPDNTFRIDFESGMNYLEMALQEASQMRATSHPRAGASRAQIGGCTPTGLESARVK